MSEMPVNTSQRGGADGKKDRYIKDYMVSLIEVFSALYIYDGKISDIYFYSFDIIKEK
ncbi:hypothetical protein [uncultured Dialister sp.]|uniref:hypothetical protein n=1 Tax=uncultured Dialister sp. TaxID=278064 RepID=UPI00265A3DCA|nr:hypothetical protein [uncultured Dialister sp.]